MHLCSTVDFPVALSCISIMNTTVIFPSYPSATCKCNAFNLKLGHWFSVQSAEGVYTILSNQIILRKLLSPYGVAF